MREGIEAFLIVAITAGILRQTGRAALLPALYWGTGIAVVVSFVASYFFCASGEQAAVGRLPRRSPRRSWSSR